MNHSDHLEQFFLLKKKTGGGKSILSTKLNLRNLKVIVDFILFSSKKFVFAKKVCILV